MPKYKYKGEIYTEEELVDELISENKYLTTGTFTYYYLGDEYIGNDDDLGYDEIIEQYLDGGYDDGEIEEIKEKEK